MKFAAMDDENLIRAVTQKNAVALEVLYDRYGRLVFSMAYNVISIEAVAEEITQDVFIQVWQRAVTYNPGHGKVTTWLASIARHRAIDVYRRQRSHPDEIDNGWEEDSYELPDSLDLQFEVESSEQAGRVRTALNQLPDEQKRVLALAFFKGLTQQEIADEIDEPLGTVKTRIRLAMQKLRLILVD